MFTLKIHFLYYWTFYFLIFNIFILKFFIFFSWAFLYSIRVGIYFTYNHFYIFNKNIISSFSCFSRCFKKKKCFYICEFPSSYVTVLLLLKSALLPTKTIEVVFGEYALTSEIEVLKPWKESLSVTSYTMIAKHIFL